MDDPSVETRRKQERERKARWRAKNRERLAQEEKARRARAKQREVLARDPDPKCRCCGEQNVSFLHIVDDQIRCRNCAFAEAAFGLCPHQGIHRRLG